MSIGNANGGPLNLKNVMSAASWVIQAALIGLVSLLAHWISNQNDVNTQTTISLNNVISKLADREEAYKDLKLKYEKVEERQHMIELTMAQFAKPPAK